MRHLSNKEKKDLQDGLPPGYEISKKDELKEGKDNILYKNEEKYLIRLKNSSKLIPHLKTLDESKYKAVYVDKGAIPFVIKGADLMRPGIQKIDKGIEKEEIILVRDENHNKTIAIGQTLNSTNDLEKQEKGKSVKIYHYVGDEYY